MTDPDRDVQPADRRSERGQKIDACLRRRNRIEFIGGGIAIGLLTASGLLQLSSASSGTGMMAAVGNLMLAVGLALALTNLTSHIERQHTAISAVLSRDAALAARLRSERDFLFRIWSWYILPMVPGLLIVWIALIMGASPASAISGTLIMIAVLAGVVLVNRRAADQYGRELRRLNAVD